MPSFQMEIAISGDFGYAKSVSARNEDSFRIFVIFQERFK